MEDFPLTSKNILQALIGYFDSKGVNQITDFLLASQIQAVQVSYDNWNGGTYYYCLNIEVPSAKFKLITTQREVYEQQILEKAQLLSRPYPNHTIHQINLIPTLLDEGNNPSRLQGNQPAFSYVDLNRINELKAIKSPKFDLTKLIALCEELNIAFANSCYLSVAMITRAILDHIPPIFNLGNFSEVANNYGGKSIKHSLQNLQNSFRNIADAYLHQHIRDKETLPNKTQVNFSNDLDVLLAEIVRVLK